MTFRRQGCDESIAKDDGELLFDHGPHKQQVF
jgi:hypothetical protein